MTSRRRTLTGAIGIALAGTLVFAAFAPISSAQAVPIHLDVFNAEGPFEKDIDVGKVGFGTAGDYAVESQPLLDPDDGSTLGRSLSQVTIVRQVAGEEDVEILLQSTLRLPEGTSCWRGACASPSSPGAARWRSLGGQGASTAPAARQHSRLATSRARMGSC